MFCGKRVDDPRGMSGVADAGIGDDERPAKPEVSGNLPHARDGPGGEQHARARLEVERDHLK